MSAAGAPNAATAGPLPPQTGAAGARWAVALAVVALVAVHCALALTATLKKSQTFDETAHLTAGYVYWRFDDYRLQPENGNLPQRLAALPLVLFGDVAFPPLDQEAWRKSDVWSLGDQFLHRSGNDLAALLLRSRAAMCLLGAALCLAVFAWARSLHGTAGGFVALTLCAFSPMILANGPLATSDTAAALFFLLGARLLWALLGRVTLAGVLACAAALSGLALSKTSAALMLPMLALMLLAALRLRPELVVTLPGVRSRGILALPRRLAAMAASLLACLLVVWLAIWAAYGFRFAPVPPAEQARFESYYWPGTEVHDLEGISALAGTTGKLVAFAARHRLLPEAFLYGTSFVIASLERYAFLNGELSTSGWVSFFPYCFLVKSTLPLLLLCATALLAPLAAAAAPRPTATSGEHLSERLAGTAPLWILLGVYAASLLTTTINLGARHMLPVYPALFVLLGGLARRRAPALRWWVLLLLAAHIIEGLRAYPDYLAYFNQVTGRRDAWRHLVDSSLDWGQDLPGLKAWLDGRLARGPRTPVYLLYFGTGSPEYHRIRSEPLDFEERSRRGLPPPRGGAYCVSATELQAVYHPVHGRWNSRYEAAYRELLANAGSPERIDPAQLAWMGGRPAGEPEARALLERLRTARLLAYLRGREPEAQIGYSILCHELSAADLERALQGPPPELAPGADPGDRS